MDPQQEQPFAAIRLHRRSESSWAVIRRSTGAIVLDGQNRLLMRLSEPEAVRLAADLSERLLAASRDER